MAVKAAVCLNICVCVAATVTRACFAAGMPVLKVSDGPFGSGLSHKSSPPPPEGEEWFIGMLLTHTPWHQKVPAPAGLMCSMDPPVGTACPQEMESAPGEVALYSRRNALHDLMGFCFSDAFLS